ncbi:DMSO/TMAO reductase YedYZ molybdopterin-dependent catalytic subunit [Microbacteriaceae bacterium SG_E_30_P1]|uniref:DMSO/TMAO reductase YedYZ molybdopterin-dependent catalytic subunit n=1 Tax=Antiquaquibacter oligotrophicus TaxID=2880260 RepID=A0ABT6KJW6_9MICO|nr:molybdopterin-dependent oxidoreductase [Antiquaquibacter oligotrophicus]MDH6180261.1 DMSO/TMAO reductase YedYZ molybdopterin-dependent catalytic subunit [Antiquaquibacter oligotrophicus]UDF13992.1 molybdopterin-dependent oxidoreductase [Antiquaquibacter oligotrophicus]
MKRETWWAAGVGVLSAAASVSVGHLVALFVAPAASPLLAVGAWVIDIVPPWVKDAAIALFGTGDKVALLVSLGLLVAVLAVLAGVVELRRSPWGVVILVIVGAIATAAALSRAGSTINWAIPTAVGVAVGAGVLRITADRLRRWSRAPSTSVPAEFSSAGVSRRGFLTAVAVSAGVAALAGVASGVMSRVTEAANTVREAIRLPKPAVAAPPIPAEAELDIEGLATVVTPNASFYRIDTALGVPKIDPSEWRLRITGMVENEIEIGWDELLALPLEEAAVTLTCVSNPVGGDLIGNAVWLGYPIRHLLERARPTVDADMVLSRSIDGWTASTPLESLTDDARVAMLAVGMNGEPLPLEHGFPVRMVVAGLYGYVSATKWVTELTVTRFDRETAYWTDRGWAELGPIKMSSRIDVPRAGVVVDAGRVVVAGVAWAQHKGIHGVQVSVDRGEWHDARLAEEINVDTWVQWVWEWDAEPGDHELQVRATDAFGGTQSPERVAPVPDGAEGWHTVRVSVA